MERVVVMTRELKLKELFYARMMKPVIEHHKVIKLDTPGKLLEFIISLCREDCYDQNFERYLVKKSQPNLTPSELFYLMLEQDDCIPPLYVANYENGRYSVIEKMNNNTFKDYLSRVTGDDYYHQPNTVKSPQLGVPK